MVPSPTASAPQRFHFCTQDPRTDGCGIVVLKILTDERYEDIVRLVWPQGAVIHHTTWADLMGVLAALGWALGSPITTNSWTNIKGVAIVHVRPDHFVLYDGVNRLIYDPAERQGPQTSTELMPTSYLLVEPARQAGPTLGPPLL